MALERQGRLDEAAIILRAAHDAAPGDPSIATNLANVLRRLGRLIEASTAYRRALDADTSFVPAIHNSSLLLLELGEVAESLRLLRTELELRPIDAKLHSALLFNLHYDLELSPQDLFDEHRAWERLHAMSLKEISGHDSNGPSPDRRLRIGYISEDFREHTRARFIESFISNHDMSVFDVFCYSDVLKPDALTEKFQNYADTWRVTVGMSDDAVASIIRQDQIDILVELSGHMAGNRLLVFARKPAPVQVCYPGYPDTTGLSAIDYCIGAEHVDAPGSERFFTEKLIRLSPGSQCYTPTDEDLESGKPGFIGNGFVTFGSLNKVVKVNDQVAAVWSEILKQAPRSKLMLLAPGGTEDAIRKRFGRHGIEPNRLILVPRCSRREYLERYRQIDIGLDPWPYNGHTTTLDAFWMGVPPIVLEGLTRCSREGYGLCKLLNLEELIATTADQYVRIAVELASSRERIVNYRSTLRQRMQASPLMDAVGLTRRLEAAYREMWHTWCAKQTPSSPRSTTSAPQPSMQETAMIESALKLERQGRRQEAELVYRQILARNPHHSKTLHLLGLLCFQTGRQLEGFDLIRRSIKVEPGNGEYHSNLAAMQGSVGKFQDAIVSLQRAIELRPNHATTHNNLGVTLERLGRRREAVQAFERAVELSPDNATFRNNYANALRTVGQHSIAATIHREVVGNDPNNAAAWLGLAQSHFEHARGKEAIAAYRRAIELSPNDPDVHGSMLFSSLHLEHITAEEIYDEHVKWGRQHADPLPKFTRYTNTRDPNRRLKIGYISADFREHTRARFIEPVLGHHDHEQFEVVCYSDVKTPDAITRRFQAYADTWVNVLGWPHAKLAEKVHSDGIDILIELTGHMGGSRLLVFAQKPAPMQISWPGNPSTTGVSTIDYCIVDDLRDPAGSERHFVEKLIRLPISSQCYQPAGEELEPGPPPFASNGFVTFASLNKPIKHGASVIKAFAGIMTALPQSKLMLLAGQSGQDVIFERFAAHGIANDRILLIERVPRREYLELHRRIDINLDPWPYNGHTTLLDGLWMGVPAIALTGLTHASREGMAGLTLLGLSQLVASTPDEYVKKAIELGSDPGRLRLLRAELRSRMQASPLMDARGLTLRFENVLRYAWQQWCSRAL